MSKNRIKGITVEINGDTVGLSKALEGVNKNINSTQAQLKDVEKLLKLDPTNTELLSQKQRLLGDAISETKNKLGALKEASELAAESAKNYDAWKAKYEPLKQEISKTEEQLEKLRQRSEKADEQLANGEISKEKYDKLQDKIHQTETKLSDLKTSAKNVDDEFGHPISPEKFDALQREIAETEINLRNLETQVDKSKSALEKMSGVGTAFENAGSAISGVGSKFMPLTTGIAAVGTYAVKTAADFDKAMSEVKAISGTIKDEELPGIVESAKKMNLTFEEGADATETATNIIRAKALQMAETTKFSASESADAFKYMAMAGWDVGDMLNGIEGVMDLAAASNEDLALTSDIVTDAMTALNMKTEETGHFTDVLAAASSNSNTNVSLLGESFKYAAPVAGAMGANIDDLAVALGLMASSGVKGSQAGNSLKNALVNLVKPTEEQAAAMEELGLMTTQTVTKVDSEKVEKAQTAVKNKTIDLQKAQISYNDAVNKYGETSSQAQKALLNVQKAENNLTQAQNDLTTAQKGTIETVGTGQSAFVDEYGNMKSLGEIMGILRENLGAVNVDLVDSEGNAREYEDIISELSETEEGLTQAEQLKNAAVIFGKQNLSGMLAIINASESDYHKLTDAIYGCDGTAQDMAETMQDNLSGQLTILMSQLQELAISFGDILMPTIRNIVAKVQELVDKFNALPASTKETIAQVALVVAALGPVLIVVGKVVSSVGTLIKVFTGIPAVISKVKTAFTAVKTAMTALNSTFLTNPIFLVITAITALVSAFIYFWNTSDGFRNFWIGLWEEIQNTLYNFFDSWETGWNAIADFFVNLWNSIKTTVTTVLDGIKTTISTIWNSIKTTVSTVMDGIKTTISTIWDNVKTAVSNKITSIKTTIEDGFNKAKTFVTNLADEAWDWGKDMIENIVSGIKSVVHKVSDAVTDVADKIREVLHFSVPDKGPLADFEKWMPDFMNGLAKGINKNKKVVQKAVTGVANVMKTALTGEMNYSINSGNMPIISGISGSSGTVNNYYNTDNSRTINQTNNSPKSLSRLEIYRQTRNALKESR